MKSKNLFSIKKKLHKKDKKKHLSYAFEVKENFDILKIEFSYSPKELACKTSSKKIISKCLKKYTDMEKSEIELKYKNYLPLKNLLTISIDDSNGFRGAAHRQNNNEIFNLSADFASPGMISGLVTKGSWNII